MKGFLSKRVLRRLSKFIDLYLICYLNLRYDDGFNFQVFLNIHETIYSKVSTLRTPWEIYFNTIHVEEKCTHNPSCKFHSPSSVVNLLSQLTFFSIYTTSSSDTLITWSFSCFLSSIPSWLKSNQQILQLEKPIAWTESKKNVFTFNPSSNSGETPYRNANRSSYFIILFHYIFILCSMWFLNIKWRFIRNISILFVFVCVETCLIRNITKSYDRSDGEIEYLFFDSSSYHLVDIG